jgi:hypothetical protein
LRYLAVLVSGVLLGMIGVGALRFVSQQPEHHVHFHANWAVFVDGERVDLTGARYMEDVYQCMADPTHQEPEQRVHMHEGNQDVIHVHASGVTWGHLLANLGFGVGDDYLYTDQARLESTPERTLKFILDGDEVESIRNLPIGDEDRLLISYGPEPLETVIQTQFPLVASNAGEYNERPDPASCSGAVEETLSDRLRRAFWF